MKRQIILNNNFYFNIRFWLRKNDNNLKLNNNKLKGTLYLKNIIFTGQ